MSAQTSGAEQNEGADALGRNALPDPNAAEAPAAQRPDLSQTAAKIRALIHGIESNELTIRYAVAVLVREEQLNGRYRDNAVAKLAEDLEDLGLSAKTLMNHAAVATHFSSAEIESLARRTGGSAAKPFRATWTHAMFFAEKGQREGSPLVERVFAEGLNTARTRDAWDELNGTTKTAAAMPEEFDDEDNESEAEAVDPIAATINRLASLRDDRPLIVAALDELEPLKSISEAQVGSLNALREVLAEVDNLIVATAAKVEALLAKHAVTVVPAGPSGDSPGGREHLPVLSGENSAGSIEGSAVPDESEATEAQSSPSDPTIKASAPSRHLPMRQPIDIYDVELTTGIERSPEFEKKLLCTHAINAGLKCSHACTYCSTNTLNRTHPKFEEIGRTSYDPGFSIIDPTMVGRVRMGAKKLKGEDIVMISTTVDAWAPDAFRHDLGRKLLEAVLGQPNGQARVLTKSASVSKDFDLIQQHRDRVLVGMSITATPDTDKVIAAIEPNAALISKRMAVMKTASEKGLRTYGMLCPLFPGIADAPEQIDELVKFCVRIGVEEIFAEAVNPRGNALSASERALGLAGFTSEAAAVKRVRSRANWSAYVLALVTNVQRSVRRHYDISRLRFLLYPDGLLPGHEEQIRSDDAGVIWLGKKAEVELRPTAPAAPHAQFALAAMVGGH